MELRNSFLEIFRRKECVAHSIVPQERQGWTRILNRRTAAKRPIRGFRLRPHPRLSHVVHLRRTSSDDRNGTDLKNLEILLWFTCAKQALLRLRERLLREGLEGLQAEDFAAVGDAARDGGGGDHERRHQQCAPGR